METLTKSPGFTSTCPASLRNSSIAMMLSDFSPAFTTTKFSSTLTTSAVMTSPMRISLRLRLSSKSAANDSPNSSNSNRLREVAEHMGADAYMVDSADELRPEWISGQRRVGVTAGASAPEILVNELVARLKALGAQSVRPLTGIEEKVVFSLPRELKV